MLYVQRFAVSFEYPVYFGTGLFRPENSALVDVVSRREPTRRHRLAVMVERRVAELWPALCDDIARYTTAHAARLELAALPLIEVGSEACKNDEHAAHRIAAWLDGLRMDRQSVLVVIGGGALLDLAGYAAAITHRGVRIVRVPTTVLAQNDSGVGVKNGVNAFNKKNFLGTFAPPFAVMDDFDFLRTLEPRDKVSGMAEAVKVALVKDGAFFEWLEGHAASLSRFEMDAVSELIRRCAALHLEHIAGGGDPFELGSSRPLDFGHWAAHKLESLSAYELRHGEAVAIGIALDTRYSVETGLLRATDGERVLSLLERIGLPTWDSRLDARTSNGRRCVLDGVREFREHLGGDLTLMMLEGLGKGREVRVIDEGAVERAIDWLRVRAGRESLGARPASRSAQEATG